MGNICSDGRPDASIPWSDVLNACVKTACLTIISAIGCVKDSKYIEENGDNDLNIDITSFAPLTYDDCLLPTKMHGEEWSKHAFTLLSELTELAGTVQQWRRTNVSRASRILFTAQAKLTRIIAPTLLTDFANKTSQPLGYGSDVLRVIAPIVSAHYTKCIRESSSRCAPLFDEADKDFDDAVSIDDVQVTILPQLLILNSKINSTTGKVKEPGMGMSGGVVAGSAPEDGEEEVVDTVTALSVEV